MQICLAYIHEENMQTPYKTTLNHDQTTYQATHVFMPFDICGILLHIFSLHKHRNKVLLCSNAFNNKVLLHKSIYIILVRVVVSISFDNIEETQYNQIKKEKKLKPIVRATSAPFFSGYCRIKHWQRTKIDTIMQLTLSKIGFCH